MIRLMTESDIPRVIELEEMTLHTTLGDYFFKQAIASPLAGVYVYDDGKVNGYISTMFDGEVIEVLNFCVDPSCQRSGIGSKLLAYTIEAAKNAKSVILEVRESNIKAISFYYKHGLRLIHKRKGYYSNGEDAYVYQKNLVNLDELEHSYMEIFCKFEQNDSFTKYYNDSFKGKYYHNYYRIFDVENQDKIINELMDKPINGNLIFMTSKESDILKDFETDHNVYMHAFSCDIMPLKKNGIVKTVDNTLLDELFEFLKDDAKRIGGEYQELNPRSFIEAYKSGKMLEYVVLEDNKIVGFVSAAIYGDAAKIEDLFVNDNYQHKGYGSSLFMGAVEDLKKRGVNEIFLMADYNDTPKDMYKKMGFNIVRDVYFSRKA